MGDGGNGFENKEEDFNQRIAKLIASYNSPDARETRGYIAIAAKAMTTGLLNRNDARVREAEEQKQQSNNEKLKNVQIAMTDDLGSLFSDMGKLLADLKLNEFWNSSDTKNKSSELFKLIEALDANSRLFDITNKEAVNDPYKSVAAAMVSILTAVENAEKEYGSRNTENKEIFDCIKSVEVVAFAIADKMSKLNDELKKDTGPINRGSTR